MVPFGWHPAGKPGRPSMPPPAPAPQAGADALSMLVPAADFANHCQQPSCLFWLSEEDTAFQLVSLEVRLLGVATLHAAQKNTRCDWIVVHGLLPAWALPGIAAPHLPAAPAAPCRLRLPIPAAGHV